MYLKRWEGFSIDVKTGNFRRRIFRRQAKLVLILLFLKKMNKYLAVWFDKVTKTKTLLNNEIATNGFQVWCTV